MACRVYPLINPLIGHWTFAVGTLALTAAYAAKVAGRDEARSYEHSDLLRRSSISIHGHACDPAIKHRITSDRDSDHTVLDPQ
jgi:hypothetical protein